MCCLPASCLVPQGYVTALLPFDAYLSETPPIFRERVSDLEENAFNAPPDTKREGGSQPATAACLPACVVSCGAEVQGLLLMPPLTPRCSAAGVGVGVVVVAVPSLVRYQSMPMFDLNDPTKVGQAEREREL